LDNSLQQKIRMAQQLDDLLTQQQHQVLQQNQPVPPSQPDASAKTE